MKRTVDPKSGARSRRSRAGVAAAVLDTLVKRRGRSTPLNRNGQGSSGSTDKAMQVLGQVLLILRRLEKKRVEGKAAVPTGN